MSERDFAVVPITEWSEYQKWKERVNNGQLPDDYYSARELEIAYCLGLLNRKGQTIDELSAHLTDVQDSNKVDQLKKFIQDLRAEHKAKEEAKPKKYSRWDFRWSEVYSPIFEPVIKFAVEHRTLGQHIVEIPRGAYAPFNDSDNIAVIYKAIEKKLNIIIE
jgi:hypothetical protein